MDLNELIRQSVNDVLAETPRTPETPAAAQVTPANTQITLNIQGKPVTFANQADLEAQLNATAVAIQEQQARAAVPPPALAGAKVTSDEDGSAFTNEEFIKLMNEDPRKATNYALSHLMFDGKVEDPATLIKETMLQSATQSRQLAAYQFRDTHKEVPIEDPRVGNSIEEVRKELGLPFTAQGLEAAYIYGVGKGRIPNFQQISQQNLQQYQPSPQFAQPNPQYAQQFPQYAIQQYQQPQNQYLQGPPSPGRSTNQSAPVMLGDIEDMSVEQLGSLLNKLSNAGVS